MESMSLQQQERDAAQKKDALERNLRQAELESIVAGGRTTRTAASTTTRPTTRTAGTSGRTQSELRREWYERTENRVGRSKQFAARR